MAHPEDLLLSAVLRTGDLKTVYNHGVSQEMFLVRMDEWRWIEQQYSRYGKVPSKEAFRHKFPDMTIYRVDDVGTFSGDVKQEFARASLTDLMDRAVDLMMKGKVDKALNELGSDLLSIQAAVLDQQHDYDLTIDWNGTYEAVKRRIERVQRTGRAGVPTGFGTLDLITGGLQPHWLTFLGARLGMGKTWTMVRMATEAALTGHTALYYSLEQSEHEIAMRMHTKLSRELWGETFRHRDLMRGGGFDLQSYRDFLGNLDDLLPGRLVVNDTSRGRVGPMTVAAGIEREEPDVVFIDYLTLMKQQGDGGWLSIAELTSSLQQVAQRYPVSMVVAAQLNRTAVGSEEPDPGTFGRGDTIGQDADLNIMVFKKSVSVRKLSVPKFRHGEDGQNFFVRWKPNTGDLDECSGDEAGALIESDRETD